MVNSGLLKFNENNKYPIVEVPYDRDDYQFSDYAVLDITYRQIAELLKNDQIVCFQIPADKNSLNKPLTFFIIWYAFNESGELTEIEASMAGAYPGMDFVNFISDYNIDNQDANVYMYNG